MDFFCENFYTEYIRQIQGKQIILQFVLGIAGRKIKIILTGLLEDSIEISYLDFY